MSPGSATTPFHSSGYAVLDHFLDEVVLSALRAEVERVARAPHDPSCVRPHNTLLPLRWNDAILELVLASAARVERLRDAVSARDLRWVSGYISRKEPGSDALAWHQDWWCWDHPVSFERDAAQVALLSYLSATDAESGALRVLPRSHRASTPFHAVLAEAHASSPTPRGGLAAMHDHPDQVTLTADAGDTVVIDYRLLHGTHPNRTRSRRDCLLLSFAPSWRDLPADVRAHLISHPAQPIGTETPAGAVSSLLPRFEGVRRDLRLNRVPPTPFAIP